MPCGHFSKERDKEQDGRKNSPGKETPGSTTPVVSPSKCSNLLLNSCAAPHDVHVLDSLPIEAGAFYVMDRGCLDFGRLHRLTLGLAFFVTRAKTNLDFSRRSSRRVDKTTGLRSDQTIVLNGPKTSTLYPGPLRRINYCDPETGKRLVFLTNNFDLAALTIAKTYRRRP